MNGTARRTLIVTLPPYITGGVAVSARILADHLRDSGHDVSIGHYATLTQEPELCASLSQTLTGKSPRIRHHNCLGGYDCISVGCRLPELEFTYTRDSKRWHDLIAAHDRFIVVGGTVVAANPLAAAGVPHLVWCASDVEGDRANRRDEMPLHRRLWDRLLTTPALQRMERRVLKGSGRILAISEFTVASLQSAVPETNIPVVPIPVDTEQFRPPETSLRPGRIGFVGRLADPRKNLPLLLEATALLRQKIKKIELVLVGNSEPSIDQRIRRLGLETCVEITGEIPAEALSPLYQSFDVLALPSLQEGLAIVGLEAMACGVPVIATRCGGPASYLRDGQNGLWSDFSPQSLANAIARLIEDRAMRNRMGDEARETVLSGYSHKTFSSALNHEWRAVWNEDI
jgi:glycosyltransferase involved in cell wall biosynthesis